jgi:hypothetical protein
MRTFILLNGDTTARKHECEKVRLGRCLLRWFKLQRNADQESDEKCKLSKNCSFYVSVENIIQGVAKLTYSKSGVL